MAMRVGINAFGRIGPTCLRAALDRAEAGIQEAHMVAINDREHDAVRVSCTGDDQLRVVQPVGRPVADDP
ncbi:hypothetical protein AB0D91_32490 [Streptomyces canus]|uniref:hypothetical protein n=1 Tax=Streptomyces canus TaxID=58343 RepID=UPI0033C828DA